MITDIKALVDQFDPSVLSEGVQDYMRQSKMGQLFTASWKERLLLAGKLWVVTVGTLTGEGDVGKITGGGAGTTIDLDQPETIVGVDSGYFLIPVEVHVAAICDLDADGEHAGIVLAADRSAAPPTSVTGTIETPLNLLDGGPTFPGRAFSAVTADIANPSNEELLSAAYLNQQAATELNGPNKLELHYEPNIPDLLAGPCSVTLYWGGTAAVTALARIVFAAVPTSWFPVS